VTYMDAVRTCLSKYADFTGRARRSEYWYWLLFIVVVDIVTSIIDAAIGTNILSYLGTLALLVPSIAVGVRRLHDLGKSGWYLLIGIIPIVGWIIVIVWAATEGSPEANEYGPSPKAQTA
jgi:uncharacterized membrane protein YhaH (DUF805 family)